MPTNSLGAACKRALDVAVALASVAILLPAIGVIAVAIRWSMGSPVLFRQLRPGKGGKPFVLFKFRTMTEARSEEVDPSTDAIRLTRLGSLLRRLSLDELPQLWNVLKGDMSLVGPRPLLPEYLNYYTTEQARRHEVKPGVTGLAQVKGRNAITWEQKFHWDVWYVDHWSFWLDIRIVFSTVEKVVRSQGISQEGHATIERFGASSR